MDAPRDPGSTGTPTASGGDLVMAFGLALLGTLAHLPMVHLAAGGCDEWHVLQIGVNLLRGDLLYSDTNHIAGPGAFYGIAGLFGLFGESFSVARSTMLFLFALLTALSYLLTRRLTGRTTAVLATLALIAFRLWTFPHFTMFHYATTALVLVTLAFWILQAQRRTNTWRLIAAGVLGGVAFLTKQDSGAFGTAGILLALLLAIAVRSRAGGPSERWIRDGALLLVAAATPILLSGAYFALHGGLGPYLWQTIYDPLFLNPLYDSGAGPDAADYVDIPALQPFFEQDHAMRRFLFSWMPGLFWDLHWRDVLNSTIYRETNIIDVLLKVLYRLPTLVLVLEAISLLRAWRRLRLDSTLADSLAARFAQFSFTAGMWMAFSKPRDWIHFSILLIPFVPIFARQLSSLLRSLPRGFRPLLTIPAAATLVLFFVASGALELRAIATYNTPVRGERGEVWVRPEDAIAFQGVIDHLRETPPDQPVLAVPCLPVLSFLADRPPASRFIFLWPRDAYADRDAQVIADLEARKDTSIIYVLMHTPFAPRPQVTSPELFDYLAENYVLDEAIGAPDRLLCGIAKRRGPDKSDAGSVQLGAILDEAQAAAPDGSPLATENVAGIENWPLTRDVLYLAPGAAGANSLTFRIRVPQGARLQTSAGVHPDLWQSLGPFPLRLGIEIVSPRGSETILREEKDVFRRPEERLWTTVDADLSSWEGEEVEIRFTVEARGWEPGERAMAGFAEPRVIVTQEDGKGSGPAG